MKEISLTRGQTTLIDDEDFDRINALKWQATVKHYKKAPDQYYATHSMNPGMLLMHRFILSAPKGQDVDHKDGNSLNNQKDNLRLATKSQNGSNRGKTKHNKTGYKGVFLTKNKQRFWSQIRLNGQHYYLGTFATAKEAATAYNKAAVVLHGEFG